MTAVPTFLAFIFPFLVTVATFVSEDFHFSMESPLPSVAFTAVVLFPFCSTIAETFNVTVAAVGCGVAADLHRAGDGQCVASHSAKMHAAAVIFCRIAADGAAGQRE